MVIADTGFVVAVAIGTEKHHSACVQLYHTYEKIYLPQSTLAETAYLLTKLGGTPAVAHFLEGLGASRYETVLLFDVDFTRSAEILRGYADSRIDFVDASIAAVAEGCESAQFLHLTIGIFV